MSNARDAIDFSKEPVGKLFRKMFLPTLIGMVSMVVLNITDGAFVGHGVGSDALAAVNIVAPLFMIMGGVGLMFGIGSSVVASIHLAKNNEHAANLNLTQGIVASIICGIILGIVIFVFQKDVCRLFGCNENLLDLACSYLRWIAFLMPFNMFGMTAMFMVRLDGHPRFAMIINCAMAGLNIILDYLFIFPFRMGLEGAAIATTTAFTLGNIPLMWFLLNRTQKVHLCRIKSSLTSIKLTIRNLLYQMKIGASGFIGEIALSSIMIVGNYVFINYLGEDGVAAFSVGCYCLPIVFMIGNAIVNSIQPIASFAYGANDDKRLKDTIKISLSVSIISGLSGMMIMCFGARYISTIFLDSSCHAYTLCCEGLPLYSSAFLFIAINVVLVGFLQSIEKAAKATIFTILRGFIFSIPCFILLPLILGANGLWLALPLAEVLTTVIISISFICTRK